MLAECRMLQQAVEGHPHSYCLMVAVVLLEFFTAGGVGGLVG